MTVRGGGIPEMPLGFMPNGRMGPPLRSFAADAHDCIMVRVFGPTEYKVAARLNPAQSGLPSDRHRDRIERAVTLYSVGPKTRTMMQSCASAAKLRSGGPILHNGMKAMVFAGPRHLEPSSAPHRGADRDRQAIGRRTFNSPCSSRRAHRDTLWNHALPHQPPQRDQEFAGQCDNHGLAGFRCMLRTPTIPLRKSAVLLEQE